MLVTDELNEISARAPGATVPSSAAGDSEALTHPDRFPRRHIGPGARQTREMLVTVGYTSLEALAEAAVPSAIRLRHPLRIPAGRGEGEVLKALKELAAQNQVFRSYIGIGYSDCITPAVIQRNILENPG